MHRGLQSRYLVESTPARRCWTRGTAIVSLAMGATFLPILMQNRCCNRVPTFEIVKATGAINLTQSHRWGRIITVAPDTGKIICDIPGGPVEPQPKSNKGRSHRCNPHI